MGVVLEFDFVVTVLAPVEEDRTLTEDDSIVWLELDRASATCLNTVDEDILGGLFTLRVQVRAVAVSDELSVVDLNTNTSELDLRIVLFSSLLATDLSGRML